MSTIQKAGAIVLSQKNPSHVALIYRSKQRDWSFPKGHVEEDESAVEATCREVTEETGLPVRLVGKELTPMEYDHPNGHRIVVRMFLLQSENDHTLKPEFEGDKILWIPYKEVTKKLSYDNTKQYYASVLAQIEATINTL